MPLTLTQAIQALRVAERRLARIEEIVDSGCTDKVKLERIHCQLPWDDANEGKTWITGRPKALAHHCPQCSSDLRRCTREPHCYHCDSCGWCGEI